MKQKIIDGLKKRILDIETEIKTLDKYSSELETKLKAKIRLEENKNLLEFVRILKE